MDIDTSQQEIENTTHTNSKGKNLVLNSTLNTKQTEQPQIQHSQTKQSKALFNWIKYFPITEEMKEVKKLKTSLLFQVFEFFKNNFLTLLQKKKLDQQLKTERLLKLVFTMQFVLWLVNAQNF